MRNAMLWAAALVFVAAMGCGGPVDFVSNGTGNGNHGGPGDASGPDGGGAGGIVEAGGGSGGGSTGGTTDGTGGSTDGSTGGATDGNGGGASGGNSDDHEGPDAVCAECKVTGGGQIVFGDTRMQFAVEAIPESGSAQGAGFGGEGIAASGRIQFGAVPASEGAAPTRGTVDTILSCGRENGSLSATVAGTLEGGGRFELSVTDGGEPADDTIFFHDELSSGPVAVAAGNIQIHGLDRCESPCPPGQCLCPDDHVTCEPCDAQESTSTTPPPAGSDGATSGGGATDAGTSSTGGGSTDGGSTGTPPIPM